MLQHAHSKTLVSKALKCHIIHIKLNFLRGIPMEYRRLSRWGQLSTVGPLCCWYPMGVWQKKKNSHPKICDPLSENLVLPANIEFEFQAILSVQPNSDYYTKVLLQEACTVSYGNMKSGSATIKRYKLELTGRSVKYGTCCYGQLGTHFLKTQFHQRDHMSILCNIYWNVYWDM